MSSILIDRCKLRLSHSIYHKVQESYFTVNECLFKLIFGQVLYRLDQPHGPGSIYVAWRPGNSTHLATTGYDSTVAIFDRQGDIQERISIPGLCTGFGWDSDGDLLAIIAQNSSCIILWDATTGKRSQIDAGVRDGLSCMTWAKKSCLLAIGTQKGNLVLYDHINAK